MLILLILIFHFEKQRECNNKAKKQNPLEITSKGFVLVEHQGLEPWAP